MHSWPIETKRAIETEISNGCHVIINEHFNCDCISGWIGAPHERVESLTRRGR